jgi:hypothetical protein
VGLSNQGRVLLGAGSTRYSSSNGELQTKSFKAGYQTDPLEEWSFGGTFENWGTAEKLTTNSLRGLIVWTPSVWEFGLDPEVKMINWFVPRQNTRRFRSTATAVHLRLGYYGVKNLSLSLSSSFYSYYERIDTILDSGYFYDEAVDLAAGFPKSYVGISAGYKFGWFTPGIGYSVTKYQFVDGETKTTTLRGTATINKTWSVSAETGISQGDGTKSNFSSASVSYSW